MYFLRNLDNQYKKQPTKKVFRIAAHTPAYVLINFSFYSLPQGHP